MSGIETTCIQKIQEFRFINQDKKIGVTASCFDLFHAGHMLMVKDGKEHCDIFVAFLQTDPTLDRPEKNKPILSFEERKILVEGCKYIDQVFIYSTEKELYDGFQALQADIRILGDDYKGKKCTGDDLPMEVYYHDRSIHGWSTTKLRKRIWWEEGKKIKDNESVHYEKSLPYSSTFTFNENK